MGDDAHGLHAGYQCPGDAAAGRQHSAIAVGAAVRKAAQTAVRKLRMSTPRSDSMAAHCVLDAGALLGEGPVWDVSRERLYWVDITRQEIHRFDPVSGQ